jgi:predicted nucleic acid-binding protein
VKIFIDANILFSAANPASNLRRLLEILAGEHELTTSEFARIEAERNLAAKRPQWSEGLPELLERVAVVSGEAPLPDGLDLAEKDRPILAAAVASHCDVLLTGDRRDFGFLFGQTIEGVKVLPPADLARKIL